jgi:hypothetical protein
MVCSTKHLVTIAKETVPRNLKRKTFFNSRVIWDITQSSHNSIIWLLVYVAVACCNTTIGDHNFSNRTGSIYTLLRTQNFSSDLYFSINVSWYLVYYCIHFPEITTQPSFKIVSKPKRLRSLWNHKRSTSFIFVSILRPRSAFFLLPKEILQNAFIQNLCVFWFRVRNS